MLVGPTGGWKTTNFGVQLEWLNGVNSDFYLALDGGNYNELIYAFDDLFKLLLYN